MLHMIVVHEGDHADSVGLVALQMTASQADDCNAKSNTLVAGADCGMHAPADDCIAKSNTLVTGACVQFVASFQGSSADALGKLSEADFREAVAVGPTPSDQCCTDAGLFVHGVREVSSDPASPSWHFPIRLDPCGQDSLRLFQSDGDPVGTMQLQVSG
jgi:hypothetical protein